MPSTTKPTIAITGASGFLGSVLVRHFADKGWQVIALVRQPSQQTPSKDVSYRQYDLLVPPTADLLVGVDYLVHAAFIKADTHHPDAFNQNVEAAKHLIKLSRQTGVTKNIFISSMSAHEAAISIYGRQKLTIEKIFNDSGGASLRPGLIIGDGGIVKTMGDFMKSKHVVPLVDGGRQPVQIIGVEDLAKAIDQVVTKNLVGTFTIASPRVYTYKEFYQALARHMGAKVWFVPIPFGLLNELFRLAGWLHLPLGDGRDNLLGLTQLQAVDTRKDLATLDLKPSDLEDALASSRL